IDCKGLETVRRDNCQFVRTVLTNCLNTLLLDRDPNKAIEYCKEMIADLLQNKIDISHLVISKELTKTDKEYKNKQ
ncbi:MAG: DNA polymerase delta catalytic subunit, partial [Paramarteilia canceri]